MVDEWSFTHSFLIDNEVSVADFTALLRAVLAGISKDLAALSASIKVSAEELIGSADSAIVFAISVVRESELLNALRNNAVVEGRDTLGFVPLREPVSRAFKAGILSIAFGASRDSVITVSTDFSVPEESFVTGRASPFVVFDEEVVRLVRVGNVTVIEHWHTFKSEDLKHPVVSALVTNEIVIFSMAFVTGINCSTAAVAVSFVIHIIGVDTFFTINAVFFIPAIIFTIEDSNC